MNFFNLELEYLKRYFLKNLFPITLINKTFANTISKLYAIDTPKLTVPKKLLYFKLPYLGEHLSKIFKRKLLNFIAENYPQIDLRIIFHNQNCIQNYFKFKDRLPLSLVSSLVYQYTCRECSAAYIGETRKQMKVRTSQHKGISYRTDRDISEPLHSKIRDHANNFNHPLRNENFKLLSKSKDYDLWILESIFIYSNNPSLNDRQSSCELFILN